MEAPKISVSMILDNLAEEAEAARLKAQKASDVLLESMDTAIAQTPYDVVYEEDRVKLKHYRPLCKAQMKTPLLAVYALVNRETMLDIQPGRSVVQGFLERGIDLYMVDWGFPTRKDRYLSIDDHVNGYMDNMIDFILKRHKISKLNLMGICMGGGFSVIYAALHPEKLKNLVTVVTPTHFDIKQGLLHAWAKSIDADKMVETYGNMPGDLLNLGFLLMNPARLMIDKYVSFFQNIDNRDFIQSFIRMEKWIFDSPDVPGETFRQFITDCYQKNLLIQNRMEVGGQRVDLSKIRMPLLNCYGRYDHLVPPEACEHLTKKVGSQDTEDLCIDTGHIGIFVSSKCQKEFVPKIVDWLIKREDPKPARTAKAKRRRSVAKETQA